MCRAVNYRPGAQVPRAGDRLAVPPLFDSVYSSRIEEGSAHVCVYWRRRVGGTREYRVQGRKERV